MKATVCLSLLALFLSWNMARATIIQPDHSGAIDIQFAEPIGQTFTAVDPTIKSIGVWLMVFNPPPSAGVTLDLYAGAGFGGTLLETVAANPPPGPFNSGSWFDFTLASPVSLTPGSVYSFSLTTPNGYWGVGDNGGNPASDYPGGEAIFFGTSLPGSSDLAFRVRPLSVPDGSDTMILLGIGLVALVGFASRGSHVRCIH